MATAIQVESLWNGLRDNNGEPLAGGKVYTYEAGTTTPKALFTASDKSTSATNPVILDGYGRAQVWADGRYKFVVKTSADVTLYTLDNLLYGFDEAVSVYAGQSSGSGNTPALSVATISSLANGARLTYVANATNTGAVAVTINGTITTSIVKGVSGNTPLAAGDIRQGDLVDIVYEVESGSGRFRLMNVPTVPDIQYSKFTWGGTSGGAANAQTITLTPPALAYTAGQVFRFIAGFANTGAITLNVNGLGAKTIQKQGVALAANDIRANDLIEVVYDGTQFQLINFAPAPIYLDRTNTRVGINTSSPSSLLHLANTQDAVVTIESTGGADHNQAVYFKDTASNWYIGNRYGGGSPEANGFGIGQTASKDAFVISTANFVGIGTPTPASALHILNTADVSLTLESTGGAAYDQSVLFKDTASTWYVGNRYDGSANTFGIGRTGSKSDLTLDSSGHVTANNDFRVAGTANLGTGNTAAYTYFNGIPGAGTTVESYPTSQINVASSEANANLSLVPKGAGALVCKRVFDRQVGEGANVSVNSLGGLSRSGSSARRYKKNIENYTKGLNEVVKLRPVTFESINDYEAGKRFLGLIAEEVRDAGADELVIYENGEVDALRYDRFCALLINAIKELTERVAQLEAR